MELEEKYLVLKWDDIREYLRVSQKEALEDIILTVHANREVSGKPASNKYVVINQDEPYFPDVLKLIEEHS